MSDFENQLEDLRNVLLLVKQQEKNIMTAVDCIANAIKEKKFIFVCGNGGSAADSSHIAAELVGRFLHERSPMSCVSLSSDLSVVTSIANDYGYEAVFERQLAGLGTSGDVLISISTSGQSENIIRAIREARKMGIRSISLIGKGGGQVAELSDVNIIVDSMRTDIIQEVHRFIYHFIVGQVEIALG